MKTSCHRLGVLATCMLFLLFAHADASAVDVDPCAEKADTFEKLDCEKRLGENRLAVAQLTYQLLELENGGPSAAAAPAGGQAPAQGGQRPGRAGPSVPTLRRIYGTSGNLVAQIASGESQYPVRAGDRIAERGGCDVLSIYADAISVRCAGKVGKIAIGQALP